MTATAKHTHVAARSDERDGDLSGSERDDRKQSVLKRGKSAMVRSIASALVIKDADIFFLAARNGDVPCGGAHGYGLYYHDCRYLSGYEMTVAGVKLNMLVANAASGYRAVIELTNPTFSHDGVHVEKENIGVKWERLLDAKTRVLHDVITFHNFSLDDVTLPVRLVFEAGFEALFHVRSMLDETCGTLRDPKWDGDVLELCYDGKDGVTRSTSIAVTPAPRERSSGSASFALSLAPRERKQITVTLSVGEEKAGGNRRAGHAGGHAGGRAGGHADMTRARARLQEDVRVWMDTHTDVVTDNPFLQRVVARSLSDLWTLKTELDGKQYFSAGVPWFVALFGRDSIIAALQTLAFDPEIAAQTLRLLAQYQGTEVDDWRDEQPGKILHELRVGELANLNEIPHTPYYGSIDSTPLFLILLARHAVWMGSLQLFEELRDNVERALRWIDDYGDVAHNGYLSYASTSEKGLSNQGWKDSGDAIVNADGSLEKPPIALVEVQGYVYAAKRGIADLYRRAGDEQRADALEHEADALRERFERDFWMEDEGAYALALQKDGTQVAVVSSNPGQALWTGIAGDDRARRTGARLMRGDMFAGWGVRTLSSKADRYNPVGYHIGTVWPHDNSIIAAGFRRYGLDGEACGIFDGILDAATQFDAYRLPEVFAGFGRVEYEVPVHYPVACHPQAWAAGSIPFLITSCLGLEPDGFSKTLRIVRPVLPSATERIELQRVRVGDVTIDVRAERRDGVVRIETANATGGVRVDVDASSA
jgi:glycogen debranching enzyme